ncbi:MAG: hypothetical protein HQL51_11285 [Magnetococcales bacterium]|nr:hypothetical protein [Magnetococcales bacterium]
MERCPQCRATLAPPPEWAVCRRCGADWRLAQRIEGQARRLEGETVAALKRGAVLEARHLAGQAMTMQSTPFNRALTGFAVDLASHSEHGR